MKLHTNVTETTRGLVFKKPAWLMDYKLELTDEEQDCLRRHPDVGNMRIASGVFAGDRKVEVSFLMAVEGHKGAYFHSIAQQTDFESCLRSGCSELKSHIDRIQQVTTGPTIQDF